jgi:iron(III) transport system permease protein
MTAFAAPAWLSKRTWGAETSGATGRADVWSVGTAVIALLAIVPTAAVIVLSFMPDENLWPHLVSTVLPHYIVTTLALMVGVGVGTFVIGVGTAWLVTMCRFPARRTLEWALLLPLAMPAYVVAYVYTDLLEYAGPVQSAIRALFGWSSAADYAFFEIRSLGGAIAVMTAVLYPYVYLLARAAFLEQSVCALEVSRTLGLTPMRSFTQVAVPLARPAIAIGLMLVLMETLNDYGTVQFFAVPTFTHGIFDTWRVMNNLAGAAQLASVLLLFVLALIVLERRARRQQRYHHTTGKYQPLPGFRLSGRRAALAMLACAVPVIMGFVIPAAVLAQLAIAHLNDTDIARYAALVRNSLGLSSSAAVIAVLVGTFMAYGVRLNGGKAVRALSRIACLGYAVPGAVLAIGVLIPTAWLDNQVDAVMRASFGVSTGLLLTGSMVALTIAYVVRFLALSVGTAEAGLAKITRNMEGAARTLGLGPLATLRRVHLPIMRGSVLTAAILVFVDGMKELPMTVILQPFDFQTLATFVYQYASDERLGQAALPALTIVAAGILPVLLLSRAVGRSRPGVIEQGATAL